jgi:hypothetical protein
MVAIDLIEGERRRDVALAKFRGRKPGLFDRLTAAALAVVLDTGTVTTDDVRPAVPIPAGASPKIVGSVFRHLATAGLLTHGGPQGRARPARHRLASR